jgi:hypothetical protein
LTGFTSGVVLAESRERRVDQARIDLGQIVVTEAERLERAGAIVFHEHVGGRDQLLEDLAAAFGLQVERDRTLVRGLGEEAGAHLGIVQRLVGAGRAALIRIVRIVHLDDVGAEHGELIGGERPRQHMRHVDHPDAFEWTHWRPPFALWPGEWHALRTA